MAVIWHTSCKNASFKIETSNQCFLIVISASRIGIFFFEFPVSVINQYHINRLFYIKPEAKTGHGKYAINLQFRIITVGSIKIRTMLRKSLKGK